LICDFYNLPRLFWPQCKYCHGRYNGFFLFFIFLPMYSVRVYNKGSKKLLGKLAKFDKGM
jgi:hypothetical protein